MAKEKIEKVVKEQYNDNVEFVGETQPTETVVEVPTFKKELASAVNGKVAVKIVNPAFEFESLMPYKWVAEKQLIPIENFNPKVQGVEVPEKKGTEQQYIVEFNYRAVKGKAIYRVFERVYTDEINNVINQKPVTSYSSSRLTSCCGG